MTSGRKLSHTLIRSLVTAFAEQDSHVLQATNVAETWRQGYGLLRFPAFSTVGLASTKYEQSDDAGPFVIP